MTYPALIQRLLYLALARTRLALKASGVVVMRWAACGGS